jgi:monoamine oxidase
LLSTCADHVCWTSLPLLSQKCGVQTTVLEARPTLGGRCIAAHSGACTDAGGSPDGESNGGGSGTFHLGELPPLPMMLRPKGVSGLNDAVYWSGAAF